MVAVVLVVLGLNAVAAETSAEARARALVAQMSLEERADELLKLKSEIAEMTETDGFGRKMLLYDKVLNVKGALDVIKAESAGIYAKDSFENYASGTEPTAMEGWRGDGAVVAESYSPPIPPGHPMTNVTHTKVFEIDDVTKAIPDAMTGSGRMDAMICIARCHGEIETPSDDVQVRIVCDAVGRLLLWHSYSESGVWKRGWTQLSESTYADGEWIRVGIVYDSTSNHDGDAFVQVRIDGPCQVTARGVKSPQDPTPYGSWHYLAKNRHLGAVTLLSEVQFEGTMSRSLGRSCCPRDAFFRKRLSRLDGESLFGVDELPRQKALRVCVTPRDCYGTEGPVLRGEPFFV